MNYLLGGPAPRTYNYKIYNKKEIYYEKNF